MNSVTRRSIVLLAPALSGHLASAQAPLDDDALTPKVKAVESTLGARLGVSALHIESGARFRYQSDEVYPMWSSYKLPIAIQVLNRVDAGKEQSDRLVEVQPRHFSSGNGMLTDLFRHGRAAMSVRSLLELMLVVSDITATSIFLEIVGAPAVNARLRALGVTGIRVELPHIERLARLTRFELPPRE
jgi:beta-lactamase class A